MNQPHNPQSKFQNFLIAVGLIGLTAIPRLTALNQYLIVDEADRWRWAKDFVSALSRGDLAGTLVGDGYPGIVPVWAESIWILLEAGRRSLLAGQWIGEAGLYQLFHEWDRSAYLMQQRLPIVLLNTVLALAIIWAVWRLFGRRVAIVSSILLALDPFYLSDSRVNRAEAVITGLMTLSILALIFYLYQPRLRYVIISGVFGGLSFLTKIQALAILPAIGFIGLIIFYDRMKDDANARKVGQKLKLSPLLLPLLPTSYFLLLWLIAAGLTWFLLWPSMWVTPLETLGLVYDYTTHKVGAEGVDLFFMGQTYADSDPGPVFYPFALLMRITPLALLGLMFYVVCHYAKGGQGRRAFGFGAWYAAGNTPYAPRPVSKEDNLQLTLPLLIYSLVYALVMTLGSHKQDRYLLPIFLALDILAAIGWVGLWDWLLSSNKQASSGRQEINNSVTPYSLLPRFARLWRPYFLALRAFGVPTVLLALQFLTIFPHHPYYYSYFNPLMGGGPTAVRTMRVGWGEGMDQVGAYLAAKPNSRELTVSSRFTHNMLGFKGDLISLLPDGRWTQADYIVLYIQQVQRHQEPSPAFIDYFLARPPEKVISIGGIDYAWIYPIPFTTFADPEISVIPQQLALLGYSWDTSQTSSESANSETSSNDSPIRPFTHSSIRLFWENLGLSANNQILVRLVGHATTTEWTPCEPDSNFVTQAQTPGAYVESLCPLSLTDLSSGTYTVEFALGTALNDQSPREASNLQLFSFPQGWQAATITAPGVITDTPKAQRFEAIVREALPPTTVPLDRIYDGRLKLLAYQFDPVSPQPGETVRLTLYWQAVKEVTEPLRLTVQLADSRQISLGRADADVPVNRWFIGEVKTTRHEFNLPPDLETPLAGQVEVSLRNQTEVALRPTNLAGTALDNVAARFTLPPQRWPTLDQVTLAEGVWQKGLTLKGYKLSPTPAQPGQTLSMSLYWQAEQPVAENYVVFVHLVDQAGQLVVQNDDIPRHGAYPVPWWQPGQLVEDTHPLVLPPDLPDGTYQLVVGLYRSEDGGRLPMVAGGDSFRLGSVEIGKKP
ncbi:MAG: glycosyltransferase family 39 protein [Anaerolineae bacterium]